MHLDSTPNHSILHTVLILLQSEQPDDGHLKAETGSCQQQPTFAIQLNIRCVYDGPHTYFYIVVDTQRGCHTLKKKSCNESYVGKEINTCFESDKFSGFS